MKRLNDTDIRESFLSEGYTIPDDWVYITNKTHIPYVCNNGHQHKITWHQWQRDRRCYYCSNKVPPSNKEIIKSFANEGYYLCDGWKYINNHTTIPYVCNYGHKHKITWNDWQNGYRCKFCNGRAHADEALRIWNKIINGEKYNGSYTIKSGTN